MRVDSGHCLRLEGQIGNFCGSKIQEGSRDPHADLAVHRESRNTHARSLESKTSEKETQKSFSIMFMFTVSPV